MERPPPASKEQEVALERWRSGSNVVCSACAGAGKTTLLAHASLCASGPCVVLSYNKQLAEDTARMMEATSPNTQTFTFHGLCSRLFRLTKDDEILSDIIDELEDGTLPSTGMSWVECVLVDECQDLTRLHVALIRHMFPGCRYFLVGDEVQMLYDSEPDTPANIDFMTNPERHFHSPAGWDRVRLGSSFRLPANVALLVNHVLDDRFEEIVGLRPRPATVQIVNMPNFEWGDFVVRLLEERTPSSMIILTPQIKHYPPLDALLNTVSNTLGRRTKLHVHGVDDGSSEDALRVMTWHASKGCQTQTAVVIGVCHRSLHNPLHVALTRATKELYVLQDKNDPHDLLRSEAVKHLEPRVAVLGSQSAKKRPKEDADDVDETEEPSFTRPLLNIDTWSPRKRMTDMDSHFTSTLSTNVCQNLSFHLKDLPHHFEEVVRLGVLMKAEVMLTGNDLPDLLQNHVRGVRARHEIDRIATAQKRRSFSVDGDIALPLDMRFFFDGALVKARQRSADASAWLTLGAGIRSWARKHYQMRQCFPMTWLPDEVFNGLCESFVKFVRRKDASALQFDVPVCADTDDLLIFGRVNVKGKRDMFTLTMVDEISKRDLRRAAVLLRVADDPTIRHHIFNLRDGTSATVSGASDGVIDLLHYKPNTKQTAISK
jgi:hypothetical protein